MWHAIFSLGDVSVAEKILRSVLVYVFLVVALRVAGKREMAQLSTVDFIVLLAVANAVQNGIIGDETSVTGGVIGASTLFVLNGGLAYVLWRSARARKIVEGHGTVLVKNGVIVGKAMEKERVTEEELLVAVQRQGADSLDEVETATLEPGGAIVLHRRTPTREERMIQELSAKVDALIATIDGGR